MLLLIRGPLRISRIGYFGLADRPQDFDFSDQILFKLGIKQFKFLVNLNRNQMASRLVFGL